MKKYNKSQIRTLKTILPVRCTIAFTELCRVQSKVYPSKMGAKLSSARFLKEAAKEKLLKLGIDSEYLKTIC